MPDEFPDEFPDESPDELSDESPVTSAPKKFKRGSEKKSDRKDETGKVVVFVALRDGQKYRKGNVSRTITVHDAKVSEVSNAIEQALFED